jgi:RHS repeat-associated protein
MNGGFRVKPNGQFVDNYLNISPWQKGFQEAGVTNEAPSEGAAPDQSGSPSPVPSISLPKGGGAIRGIGEKFTANPVTGTGSLNVPIFTTPGRSGFGPQLSLSYDSGSSNGPFGFGWNLSLPSITRKTDKGLPKYQDDNESDVFILSGAEDLVPVFKKDQNGNWIRDAKGNMVFDEEPRDGYMVRRYRPRIEGLFARIERWTRAIDGDSHWLSISKDNILTVYGRDEQSRIADPADGSRTFSWLICESYDDKGNAIVYEYTPEDIKGVDLSQANEANRLRTANRYLKRIQYGNRQPLLLDTGKPSFRKPHTEQTDFSSADWMFEVVFDYNENHYDELPLDKTLPEDEQHRFVQASESAGGAWSVRPDPCSTYRAGFEVRAYRRCQRVLGFHRFPELGSEPCLVRSTEFDYSDLNYSQPVVVETELEYKGSTHFASFIQSVTQSGYVRDETRPVSTLNGVKYLTYLKKSLPPLEFEYSKATIHEEIKEIDTESLENLPHGMDGTRYQWVDLDGEGITGILTEQADAWFYKPNLGDGKFGPLEKVALKPSLAALSSGRQQLMDLDGDGHLDVVEFDGPVPGFYERTNYQSWQNFTPFASLPNVSWNDPNLRFVDLTGDGFADVLITEDEVFTWYTSLAEKGFGSAEKVRQVLDEEKGPRLVFNDGTQSIYLADMSGDGLTDLVRIRNGEVCYWPNTGYGRFGAKVTMDNASWFDSQDMFDQRRIRLGDVDGSGTTDIIYLGRDGVQIYFNQSGNSLSSARTLSNFPHVDDLSSIRVADLPGNGTACLIWSSPLQGDSRRQMRYIDLMGGQKPHLLVSSKNNLGAETRIHYTMSTKFYLADKAAGNPWVTRLPFPVHVVDRVETYDLISRNRFVSLYAYHHGYFDGIEREFRGFGMVEQWDTEEIGTAGSEVTGSEDTNWDPASFVPPVLTRTWFHIGAYFEKGRISKQFEEEYYHEGDPSLGEGKLSDGQLQAMLLPDTVPPPDDLTPEETLEASRSLKGGILRQEIYALDRRPDGTLTEESDRPYTVSERNYTINFLQQRGENKHAVFFVHPRETIDFHYERKLYDIVVAGQTQKRADPRVTHSFTLEVDEYGDVLKSAAIGYGRRQPDSNLSTQDQDKQTQTLITYTENHYTNPVLLDDAYRTPLQSETHVFEVLKFEPYPPGLMGITALFTFDKLQELVETVDFSQGNWDIPYEDVTHTQATDNHPYRRPIKHVRTLYRSNQLDTLLKLGSVESLALPGETYKLAFTRGLIAGVYQRERTGQTPENLIPSASAVLGSQTSDGGGYVDLDVNGNWCVPSGRIFYSQNPADNPAQELDFASKHFFVPHHFRDPFGNNTFVSYDSNETVPQSNHNLLLTETHDPLGNTMLAQNNYRVLQPVLITDPNGAISEVLFDALGLVVATAIHKGDIGDSLQNVQADLTQKQIEDFSSNPTGQAVTRLGTATALIVYDMDRYYLTGNTDKPPYAATIARETHVSDPVPADGLKVQISFSYSDGFGREVQKKIQAEPGPVDGVAGTVNPRWVGSGWTIFNNKGKPVRKYEPFFDDTHEFSFGRIVGVSSILFYDPVERVVATLHPNNTYEKIVFDPWCQMTWDVNDTVTLDPRTDEDISGFVAGYFATQLPNWQTWYQQRISGALGTDEQKAAQKTESHTNTSTGAYFDTLGRAFLTVANNGKDTNGNDIFYKTNIVLDIEGNQREVIDAKERIVMLYDYDMPGTRIKQASMEAGTRWMLNNAAGKPIRTWDSRYFNRRMTYDALKRPVELFAIGTTGAEFLAKKSEYGESKPNPETTNHRLKPWRVYDGAGIMVSDGYDFKGNLVQSNRQLLSDYKAQVDWRQNPQLENETFTISISYDALNRPIQIVAPHSSTTGTKINVTQPVYNEANLLERVEVWLEQNAEPNGLLDPNTATQHAVTNIDYDAKGQRELIEYGNGVRTSYKYDSLTFRLTHLQTLRNVDKLQDLFYTYDPVGNITFIRDDAQQTIYFNGQVVRPDAEYTYDTIYRLIEADGREHIGQASQPQTTWNDEFRVNLAHPNDGQAMRNYFEFYTYDEVGNILVFDHKANSGNWTRSFDYNEDSLVETGKKSNRLSSTVVHPDSQQPITEPYTYDPHGSMTSMPHLSQMDWDFEDKLQYVDKGTEKAYYVYDAAGQRVRKVVEKNNGALIEERIYLGSFEIFRTENGSGAVSLERETLHIMDDKQRIALVETRTLDTAGSDQAPQQLIRYQFGNHLGSAVLEMDDQAQIISYEEYYPYGSSSFQAVRSQTETPKRYRYTGKERDEESGLYYHGARYYAPWLGRWVSCDPIGLGDGMNLFAYSKCNPARFTDQSGTQSTDTGTPTAQMKEVKLTTGKEAAEKYPAYEFEKHAVLLSEFVISAEKPVSNQAVAASTYVAAKPVVDPLVPAARLSGQLPPSEKALSKLSQPYLSSSDNPAVAVSTHVAAKPVVVPLVPAARSSGQLSSSEKLSRPTIAHSLDIASKMAKAAEILSQNKKVEKLAKNVDRLGLLNDVRKLWFAKNEKEISSSMIDLISDLSLPNVASLIIIWGQDIMTTQRFAQDRINEIDSKIDKIEHDWMNRGYPAGRLEDIEWRRLNTIKQELWEQAYPDGQTLRYNPQSEPPKYYFRQGRP